MASSAPAAIKAILAESERRNAALDVPYDPIQGTGDVVGERRRVEVGVEGIEALHLPVQMWGDGHAEGLLHGYDAVPGMMRFITDAGGVVPAAGRMGVEPMTVLDAISEVRHAFDFEYWTASAVWIRGDKGQRVRFVLNRPQRIFLRVLMEMFWTVDPIRVILLKARQWGGSTLTQIFMVWIQEWHRIGWNSAIVADVEDQAAHILGMYEHMGQHYELREGGIRLHPYQRRNDIRYRRDRECYLGVGSVKKPDAARSFTFYMLHESEVGLWGSTPKQNAEDLAQSLEGGIAAGQMLPMTLCVKESTAKGVGNYFHRDWVAATKDETNDKPVFIPWHAIPKLRIEVKDPATFVDSWDEYERELWERHGCSLEQIAWYRSKLRSFRGKRYRMNAENPTTPEEAFQSTGARYFSAEAVAYARSTSKAPKLTGELRGKDRKGKAALESLRLVESEHGSLQVWREPGDRYGGLLKEGVRIVNRYVAFADPGGKSDTADYSVCKVVDRAPALFGGKPEVVAVWRGHLRPDLFAWTTAQIAAWYEDALLAFEINRMRKDHGDAERGYEPEWSIAVLEEIQEVYGNLFLREKEARADDPVSYEIGFHMNTLTKPLLVSTLDEALEEELYVERSANLCDELDTFEAKPDGTLGARDGCYDDEAIATMGAVWLATKYEHLPPPRYVEEDQKPSKRRQLAGSVAGF